MPCPLSASDWELHFIVLQGHLEEARRLCGDIPAAARPLMLPAVAAGLYLKALERHNFNAFAPELGRSGAFSPLWHQLLVKWNLMRSTY
jgi:NADH dehydrogenase [ubiquinone] 1 alpha subcomplex assembly factor 6